MSLKFNGLLLCVAILYSVRCYGAENEVASADLLAKTATEEFFKACFAQDVPRVMAISAVPFCYYNQELYYKKEDLQKRVAEDLKDSKKQECTVKILRIGTMKQLREEKIAPKANGGIALAEALGPNDLVVYCELSYGKHTRKGWVGVRSPGGLSKNVYIVGAAH